MMAAVSTHPKARPAADALFAIGVGGLLGWALLLGRIVDTLSPLIDISGTPPYPLVLALVAGLLTALGGSCGAAGHLDAPSGGTAASEARLALAGSVLALLSLASAAACAASAPATARLGIASACAALSGASIGLMALVWSRRGALLRPRALARDAAWSAAAAGALYGAARLAQQGGLGAAAAAACAVAAAGACLAWPRSGGVEAAGDWRPPTHEALRVLTAISDQGDAAGKRGPRPGRRPGGVRRVLGMLWIPLAGFLFSAFITGLTWDPMASEERAWHDLGLDVAGALVGAAVAAALVLAIARGGSDARAMGVLSRAAAPSALAVILVVPIVKEASSEPALALACSCASVAGFALITLCALVELVVCARLVGADPLKAAAAALAMAGAAYVAGIASIGFLGVGGRTLCFVLEAALLAAVAISFAMDSLRRAEGAADGGAGGGAWDDGPGAAAAAGLGDPGGQRAWAYTGAEQAREAAGGARHAAEPPAAQASAQAAAAGATGTAEDAMRARCAEVGRRFGLSPREGDVLVFIARGHSSRFIAEELCLSENTVRTHVRHIYEKTGVGSRDELFQLVDSAA